MRYESYSYSVPYAWEFVFSSSVWLIWPCRNDRRQEWRRSGRDGWVFVGFGSINLLVVCGYCSMLSHNRLFRHIPNTVHVKYIDFQMKMHFISVFEPFSGTYEKSWIIHIKPSSVEERTLGNRIASVLMVHITAIVRLGHTMELPCQPKSAHS